MNGDAVLNTGLVFCLEAGAMAGTGGHWRAALLCSVCARGGHRDDAAFARPKCVRSSWGVAGASRDKESETYKVELPACLH